MGAPIAISTATGQVSGFWAFYRRYTDTTVHTAATAALTIFGLLVFVDPWFAAVAIGSYVVPPVVLYVLADGPDSEAGLQSDAPEPTARSVERATTAPNAGRSSGENRSRSRVNAPGSDGDSDSDTDDGDTDSDSDGTDTDSDSDGTDTDSDSDDGDTDTDSDS